MSLEACSRQPEWCHGMQATEAAYQEDDAVKSQIWYEQNDARYELWRQESEVRKREQQQLQAQVLHAMRQAHARKVKCDVCMKFADCAWKASNLLQCRRNSSIPASGRMSAKKG